jgi:hypothetical protein
MENYKSTDSDTKIRLKLIVDTDAEKLATILKELSGVFEANGWGRVWVDDIKYYGGQKWPWEK